MARRIGLGGPAGGAVQRDVADAGQPAQQQHIQPVDLPQLAAQVERGLADQPAVHHRGLPAPTETTGDTTGGPPDGATVPAPRATGGAAPGAATGAAIGDATGAAIGDATGAATGAATVAATVVTPALPAPTEGAPGGVGPWFPHWATSAPGG